MPITDYRAADLLCSAFEGGSNYWYMIDSYVTPEVMAKPWGDDYTPAYIFIPFSEGGAVIIEDDDGETHTLDNAAVERGKELLATDPQYSHQYADLLQENDDGDTGDTFLQLCLFGEVIYG